MGRGDLPRGGGRFVNRNASAGFFAASPVLARVLRLVAALDYDVLTEKQLNRAARQCRWR